MFFLWIPKVSEKPPGPHHRTCRRPGHVAFRETGTVENTRNSNDVPQFSQPFTVRNSGAVRVLRLIVACGRWETTVFLMGFQGFRETSRFYFLHRALWRGSGGNTRISNDFEGFRPRDIAFIFWHIWWKQPMKDKLFSCYMILCHTT